MNDAQRLGFFGVCLVALWIVTYWLTDRPRDDSGLSISFGEAPTSVTIPQDEPTQPPPDDHHEPAPAPGGPSRLAPQDAVAPPSGGVIPPSFRMYTTERKDTARTISKKVYGTEAHWRAVQWANPLTDFNNLKRGKQIRIPVDPNNIEGVPANPEPKPQELPKAATNVPASLTPDYVEYIVEDGDKLMNISKALYGKTSLWTVIRDANRDQINEEGTNIRKGMVLKIPPLPVGTN